jgi:hypothetical protein
MPRVSKKTARARLGAHPNDIDRDLRGFGKAARVLSADSPRLIAEYPAKWVGIHDGQVAAADTSLRRLLARLKRSGIPPSKAIVRFIDRKEKSLIL